MRKRGIEARQGIHDAEAVRTYNAHLPRTKLRLDFPFERCALRSAFLESSGDHDGGSNPRLHAFANQCRNGRRRSDDDGKIDRIRHPADISYKGAAQNISRVLDLSFYGAKELDFEKIDKEGCARDIRFADQSRTNNGDRVGDEHAFK